MFVCSHPCGALVYNTPSERTYVVDDPCHEVQMVGVYEFEFSEIFLIFEP